MTVCPEEGQEKGGEGKLCVLIRIRYGRDSVRRTQATAASK